MFDDDGTPAQAGFPISLYDPAKADEETPAAVVRWAIVQTAGAFYFERVPPGAFRLKGKNFGLDSSTVDVDVAPEMEIASIELRFPPTP